MCTVIYNEPNNADFIEKYIILHNLCRKYELCHCLHFEDGPNTWYIELSDCSEYVYITKSYSLSSVLELAIEELQNKA